MMHEIEIYQVTTVNDIAILTITDEQLAELNQLRSDGDESKVKQFLLDCTREADEWVTGDTIDGELPHYYTIDGEGVEV